MGHYLCSLCCGHRPILAAVFVFKMSHFCPPPPLHNNALLDHNNRTVMGSPLRPHALTQLSRYRPIVINRAMVRHEKKRENEFRFKGWNVFRVNVFKMIHTCDVIVPFIQRNGWVRLCMQQLWYDVWCGQNGVERVRNYNLIWHISAMDWARDNAILGVERMEGCRMKLNGCTDEIFV